MRYFQNKKQFYNSKEFYDFKTLLIQKRTNELGELHCEECGKVLLHRHDTIPHHCKIPLTNENINDVNITLNEDNIQLVCFQCHNKIEKRFSSYKRSVYLIVGSPCSGKSSWVKENANGQEDLVLDFDNLWKAISTNERYIKPNRLKPIAFALRECLMEQIKMRTGSWVNCYILSTEPYVMNRKRLIDSLGVDEVIYLDIPKEECIKRLYENPDGRNIEEYEGYINNFYDNFQSDDLI